MLQVSGNTLQHVEKFKHLGMVFTSDGRQNKEIDTWIGKANANAAKLSVFTVNLTHGHASWVMTERILSQR